MSKDQSRMERFIVIPFSTCRSDSSVDVVDSRQAKKPQGVCAEQSQGGGDGTAGSAGKPKGESLVARLLKGFKNLSQIFAVYEADEEEEEEREMVIGLPTDVKHVAHIGWDGSTNTTNSVRSWNRAAPPQVSTSTSSAVPTAPLPQQQQTSMRQFELAMAAQAAAGTATAARTSAAGTTTRHCHS